MARARERDDGLVVEPRSWGELRRSLGRVREAIGLEAQYRHTHANARGN